MKSIRVHMNVVYVSYDIYLRSRAKGLELRKRIYVQYLLYQLT
jgi:hypothetical protein